MTAQVEKLHPQASLAGHVDAVADGKGHGWAWDRDRPAERLDVTVSVGDTVITSGLADLARPDLAAGGIGDGAHAFALDLPAGIDADAVTVTVRSPASGESRELTRRPAPSPESVPEELQRVSASVHSLQQVQKQTTSAVLGVLREIRQKGDGQQLNHLEQAVSDVQVGQQALMKRFESIEVFLLRFDTLMRQFDEKLNALPSADKGPVMKRLIVAGAVVGLGAVTVLMMV